MAAGAACPASQAGALRTPPGVIGRADALELRPAGLREKTWRITATPATLEGSPDKSRIAQELPTERGQRCSFRDRPRAGRQSFLRGNRHFGPCWSNWSRAK